MLKQVLITHTDLDGAGCRIIYELMNFDKKKKEYYDVYNCSLGTSKDNVNMVVMNLIENKTIDQNTIITFADICCSYELMEKLKNNGYTVNIYDHHITNTPILDLFPNTVIRDTDDNGQVQSGTSLIYKAYAEMLKDFNTPWSKIYFNNPFIERFVDNVRSYDTYEWKKTGNLEAKKLEVLFFLLGMDRFCDRFLERLKNPDHDNILITKSELEFIDARIEYEQKIIDELTPDDVYQIDVKGYKAALILGTKGASISECGNQFLTKYPQFDFVVLFNMARNGVVNFRAINEDIDLANNIAKPLGGGGHKLASGAILPSYVMDQIIELIIEALNK